MSPASHPIAAVMSVLVRPRLWWVSVRQLHRLAPRGWWRRAPFLPIPDADYLRFRMITAYGGSGEVRLVPADVVADLTWCREWA